MRPIQSALAAALALSLAASVSAAAVRSTTTTSTTSNTGTATTSPAAMPSIAVGNGSSGTFVSSAPATTTSAPAPTSTTSTTTTTTQGPSNPPFLSTVDVRNQQTLQATASTHASGSTSAIDNLLNSTTTGQTSGTTPGSTNGNGTVVSGFAFGNPSDVTAIAGTDGTALGATTLASNQVLAPDVLAGSAVVADDTQRAGVNVDRAIRQVQRDRKRIGRNGQLLYSIAPRTNVDRSNEMPDDPPSAALTGSGSTLTR